jgi:uncharacterized protein (DUF169 family)
VPVAFEQTHPTLSLGCIGMRTFTGIREDRLLAVLPGRESKLQEFLDALGRTLKANETMRIHYEEHKASFP